MGWPEPEWGGLVSAVASGLRFIKQEARAPSEADDLQKPNGKLCFEAFAVLGKFASMKILVESAED
ncbi:hypothetical protein [Microvirga tunisiensis]|uniref:Uncharacterized protein n=1 Tax=Microvirga tunisiensis TaxID=2108360 RepID=A0A5N7MVU5_9HYPH|nr:hypothetical protein [Microvirga tunisiensis]MPR12295.1 hypothetical protein [Microvirga tunisiensis]MPR30214.1 hypothetical protein [Microvirga tunisiensis]